MEAIKNYGLREGSEQEQWGQLGPLAEPTPSNAKNRGAADRRRRQRGHGNNMARSGRGDTANEGEGDNEGQGRGKGSDESETEEDRRAMAEAVWEMEREDEETRQTARIEDKAGQIMHTRATAETTGTMPTAKQQSQGQRERQLTTTTTSNRLRDINETNAANET